jgi:hypothetical protein
MTVQTLTIGKRKFVVVPEKDFLRLQADAEANRREERGDIAETKRRAREPSISLAKARKQLGL